MPAPHVLDHGLGRADGRGRVDLRDGDDLGEFDAADLRRLGRDGA
jgi:hypothetical protein